ncbi:unnamed protein product, partial [Rotaria socialis]
EKMNRFDALEVEGESDEKQQTDIKINNDELPSDDNENYDDDDDDDDEEEEEDSSGKEHEDGDLVEQVREEIYAYEKSNET